MFVVYHTWQIHGKSFDYRSQIRNRELITWLLIDNILSEMAAKTNPKK